MISRYNVIIIGGGPAGIFSAITLAKMGIDRVLLIEQGKDIYNRDRRSGKDILCGWGGAGAYSDGKLNLSTQIGGFLNEFIPERDLEKLIDDADTIYSRYGAPKKLFGIDLPDREILSDNARRAGLIFVPTRIRHMGTENCVSVLKNMYQDLKERKLELDTRITGKGNSMN